MVQWTNPPLTYSYRSSKFINTVGRLGVRQRLTVSFQKIKLRAGRDEYGPLGGPSHLNYWLEEVLSFSEVVVLGCRASLLCVQWSVSSNFSLGGCRERCLRKSVCNLEGRLPWGTICSIQWAGLLRLNFPFINLHQGVQ